MNRKTIKISFPNSRGQKLAGLLDTPIEKPLFYTVFAPCFTCTKESHGAAKICRELAEHGVAALRFDMAGLGESDGHIRDMNFTTRVEDILSACDFIKQTYEPPKLLIGHSISGTAVLSSASQLPYVQAIATVGSPADPTRVIEKFNRQNLIREIDDKTIEIMVMGLPVHFNKSFIDDLLKQKTAEETAAITKKMFIFHAPHDSIVSRDEAEIIHDRATLSDRELILLDDAATHLFETRKDDAVFVAETLLDWFRTHLK